MCRRDYSEWLVSSFVHQIKSEYYSDNIYIYIAGIVLEPLCAFQQPSPLLTPSDVSHQAIVHSFVSDEIKQYGTTKDTQIKTIMELTQNRKIVFADLSIFRGSTDGCA